MRDEVLKSPFIGERSKKLRPILPFSLVAFDAVWIPFRRSTEGKTPISSLRCFFISTVVLSRLISTLQICWLKMNWSPHADEDEGLKQARHHVSFKTVAIIFVAFILWEVVHRNSWSIAILLTADNIRCISTTIFPPSWSFLCVSHAQPLCFTVVI